MEQTTRKILIVDDDRAFRALIVALLRPEYDLAEAESGAEALHVVASFRPDLVLLDVAMPGIDGFETCRRIKAGALGKSVHVIIISAKSSRADQLHAFEVGADDYVVKPIDRHELRARVQLHFRLRDTVAQAERIQAELASRHADLRRLAAERTQEILATQDVAVFAMAKVTECRDTETGQHLVRMRAYAQTLAEELRRGSPYADMIDDRFLDDLYRSSPLHDIGKVGICDAILLKPGQLTREEFETMKRHTVIGANVLDEAMLQSRCAGFLAMGAVIARFHHERWDGTGYPAGLIGPETPLPARIVAVADVYDALTSVRPYKEALPPDTARALVEEGAGTQFDPVVVQAFSARFSDFLQIQVRHGDSHETVVGAMAFLECQLAELAT
jgi:putative two-component system response regulator